ncbi:MAG: hypothetical protein A2W19_05930 [Spirochaetes bacterium RBG_16_49_21]|nr:MAG: hypothetical protein A2W19_05930 [Spirochaetes bacterium RBG_16_49_21]
MAPVFKVFKPAVDFLLTFLLWVYFMFGYLLVYIPFLILFSPFIGDRETLFQMMNHYFYRIFFRGLRALAPGLSITVGDEVKKIRSSVVISNHGSYLDPILLISLFPRHKTIVKGVFFKIPIMSWVMKSGGYIPYIRSGEFNNYLEESLKNIARFMDKGGNLFIFPEGRRSRNGSLGNFQKGAFTIARKYKAPLQMIYIHNTRRLFPPGKIFFNSCIENTISVEKLSTIQPGSMTVREMREKAVKIYKKRMEKDN